MHVGSSVMRCVSGITMFWMAGAITSCTEETTDLTTLACRVLGAGVGAIKTASELYHRSPKSRETTAVLAASASKAVYALVHVALASVGKSHGFVLQACYLTRSFLRHLAWRSLQVIDSQSFLATLACCHFSKSFLYSFLRLTPESSNTIYLCLKW